MIDNPLPDQVMNWDNNLFISDQFNEHCINRAKEIALEFNLLPELINDFSEYYVEVCKDSDEGYSLVNDKSLIDDWWEENSDMYEDPSPYQDYEPTDLEMRNYLNE